MVIAVLPLVIICVQKLSDWLLILTLEAKDNSQLCQSSHFSSFLRFFVKCQKCSIWSFVFSEVQKYCYYPPLCYNTFDYEFWKWFLFLSVPNRLGSNYLFPVHHQPPFCRFLGFLKLFFPINNWLFILGLFLRTSLYFETENFCMIILAFVIVGFLKFCEHNFFTFTGICVNKLCCVPILWSF